MVASVRAFVRIAIEEFTGIAIAVSGRVTRLRIIKGVGKVIIIRITRISLPIFEDKAAAGLFGVENITRRAIRLGRCVATKCLTISPARLVTKAIHHAKDQRTVRRKFNVREHRRRCAAEVGATAIGTNIVYRNIGIIPTVHPALPVTAALVGASLHLIIGFPIIVEGKAQFFGERRRIGRIKGEHIGY